MTTALRTSPRADKWKVYVDGKDVSCDTSVSFSAEWGRDDDESSCSPGSLSVTLHKWGADRAALVKARSQVQLRWLIGGTGAEHMMWIGRVARITRAFRWDGPTPANDVRLDCVGVLAEVQRSVIPAGAAGVFTEQPDGFRVASVLAKAGVDLSAVRPVSGHIVNDDFPAANSKWTPARQTQTTMAAGTQLTWTANTTLPTINENVEVEVEFTTDHECTVRADIATTQREVAVRTPGRHIIQMHLPTQSIGAGSQLRLEFFAKVGGKPGLVNSMTISLHNVNVWRMSWPAGGVWVSAKEPGEQSALDHIHSIEDATRGVLYEDMRNGGVQWVSSVTRAKQSPALDLDACQVMAATESLETTDEVTNHVTIYHGYATPDVERPFITEQSAPSIAVYGKQDLTIDGPIRDAESARHIARHILSTNATPRERVGDLDTVPVAWLPDNLCLQLAGLSLGSVVEVLNCPTGWVVTGTWRAFLEGIRIQGSAGGDVSMTLRLSDYRDGVGLSLPNINDIIQGERPSMSLVGPAGPQGPRGDGLQIKSSVATVADLPTGGNTAGDVHMVADRGDLWVWGKDDAWHNVGHIVGPPGPQGPGGNPGPQGVQGPRGNGINLKGAVANQAALAGLPGPHVAGDTYLTDDTGNLWVYDGTTFVDAGHVQGPQGVQGVQGIKGDQGIQGRDGAGIRILSSVDDWTKLPATGTQVGDVHLAKDTGDLWIWDGTTWVDVGHIQGPPGQQGLQGPQGVQGVQGVQGPAGLAMGVHPPVANEAARLALTSDPTFRDDTLVLQIDTGEAWLWSGGVWTDAGHLVGPQGASGPQGVAGKDGESLHVTVARVPPVNPKPGWVWITP